MRYVLDTTAFSAAMRRDADLLSFLRNHRPGDFATVPPVVAEVEYGIRRLDNASKKYLLLKAEKDRLLSTIFVLPWISAASKYFGKIKTDLEHKGNMIDDFDIAIAAIAVAHGCAVISANIRHFSRIKVLECLNWC